MTRSLLRLLPAAALLLCAAGCAETDANGILRHEQFEVRGSGLDWLDVTYIPAPGDPRFPRPVRLSLSGSGAVSVKSGYSPLVVDDFASDSSDPHWADIVSDRTALPPDEMRKAFQTFVDNGIVAIPDPRPEAEQSLPRIRYAGAIGMEKFRYATDNAALVELVERALEHNFGPVLRRAGAPRGAR